MARATVKTQMGKAGVSILAAMCVELLIITTFMPDMCRAAPFNPVPYWLHRGLSYTTEVCRKSCRNNRICRIIGCHQQGATVVVHFFVDAQTILA